MPRTPVALARPRDYDESSARRNHQASAAVIALSAWWIESLANPAVAAQSRYPAAPDPRPMNPEDNRRLSVYPQLAVERTSDVRPFGPARDAGDQG
jgi:hypothetical protein